MRIRMYIGILLILFVIQAFHSISITAQSNNNYMHTFERLVEEKRYKVAAQLLENNKTTILENVKNEKDAYQPIMAQYLNNTIAKLKDDTYSSTDKLIATQQTVILWDAIIYENAPLWTTWKRELENKMEVVLEQKEVSTKDLDEIAYYVKVISPVAHLHLDDQQYKSYQKSLNLLTNNQNEYSEIELEETFSQISKLNVDTWNQANSQYTNWLIMIVIGFIFLSLSYVAWAKYKGEAN
ncbi:sporulation protein YpjB [Gracilibacillus kekensis]|uniref:Sporulation protein YpjB n=1 Tax=Gracilibacillus kekensis TaxID=1027249 RepID=A0A1M7PPW1_9BACI|nr:sporulation protein YpjB [Gracilibacillus kekensis]SHN19389.1 sporulation protein YpjB [Gracilibacillus kekensis]